MSNATKQETSGDKTRTLEVSAQAKDDETRKSHLVTQANRLVEARYNINSREQKIILSLISQLKPDDAEFRTYQLSIASLASLWNLSHGQLLNDLTGIIESLLSHVLKIPEPDGLVHTHWLSYAKHVQGKGYIDVRFDPSLKPYLLQLKNRFTSFRLGEVTALKSGYALRLYQLLIQYEGLKERTVALSTFREMLGVEPEQYTKYSDFRRRVLSPSLKEINEKTRIRVECQEIKTKRSIISLRFQIGQLPGRKPKIEMPKLEPTTTSTQRASAARKGVDILRDIILRGK